MFPFLPRMRRPLGALPRRFLSIAIVALLVGVPAAPPAEAASCEFVLGFATLHGLIPGIVGQCLENEHHNPTNGDGLQMTTGGLLVWRKADNWTAFTDGYRTWVNGPRGLEQRLNSQRFAWEANPDGLPVVGSEIGDRCRSAGLAVGLTGTDAGAGNVVATLRLTNTTARTCTLFGYPGLQLLDAQGNPLPTHAVWGGGWFSNDPPPSTVVLAPGASAQFRLHWGQIEVGDETTCPTSERVEITPPNAFHFIVLPMHIRACGGGRIDVSAVRPLDS